MSIVMFLITLSTYKVDGRQKYLAQTNVTKNFSKCTQMHKTLSRFNYTRLWNL